MQSNPDSIKEALACELDVAEDSLSLFRTSPGKFNHTWYVTAPDLEHDRVIRIAPSPDRAKVLFYEHRMMRQEPAIHARILETTSCPVPEILAYGWDDSRLDGRDFLIMDRLPGDAERYRQTARELAAQLQLKGLIFSTLYFCIQKMSKV